MLFRFFCDFHFFCFQLCSVCFCVVLQFRGLSFSLFSHNFFCLLCVCVQSVTTSLSNPLLHLLHLVLPTALS
jgi:hypothetical protein